MFEDIAKAWDEPVDLSASPPLYADIDLAAEIYRLGLVKQYKGRQNFTGLRASALGKPALHLFAQKFHPEWFTGSWQTERLTQLFHAGDTWEADFYLHLRRFGYEVLHQQQEIVYEGVKGHTDMIIEVGYVPILLELKTCASHRFTQYMKNPQTMSRAYRVQMAVYSKCLDIDGCWVLYNKDTSEVGFVEYDSDKYEPELLAHADKIIEAYNRIETWGEVFDEFCAPPPEAEKYKNALTGNFKVPQDIDKELAPHIYRIVTTKNNYGKDTDYVIGYAMPDGTVTDLGST